MLQVRQGPITLNDTALGSPCTFLLHIYEHFSKRLFYWQGPYMPCYIGLHSATVSPTGRYLIPQFLENPFRKVSE